ncbi:MAG: hypothetical protein M1840_005978 [Geoglossum simile]|nr:MAG: hypothetical protein M1840_005978 [Geoglossum simile]
MSYQDQWVLSWLNTIDTPPPSSVGSTFEPEKRKHSSFAVMPLSDSGRGSPKKRKAGSADAISTASGNLDVNAFAFTPSLTGDEPGSASRMRPQSPSRDLRETYRFARPPLRFSQSMDENSPQTAQELFSLLPLADTYACGVIPMNFKARIIADFSIPNPPFYVYSNSPLCEPEGELWGKMAQLLKDSRINFEENKNEKAWVVIVYEMLNAALSLYGSGSKSMVAIEDVQDPRLAPDTLPTVNNQRIPHKKVDLVLALSPNNPTVLATYTKLRTADPLVRISQFIDASLSRMTIPVYIEIGEAGKSYLEASLQLGIVGSAGLSRLEQLRRTFAPKWGDGPMMLPALGWTVIGHDWKLHIICKLTENEQDAVVVYGPYDSGGTKDYFQIFTLLRIITMVVKWVEDVYWPFFVKVAGG